MKLILFDFDGVLIDTLLLRIREPKVPKELRKILKDLSSDYDLVIVSSTTTSLIKDILGRESVSSCFSDIFGSDVNNSKVLKIRMVLEKYKIFPEETVYITDTVSDILEARKCGVKAIAVTWGFHDEKTLMKADPAKIVRSPEELVKAIKEI